jgi:hypothetical protein
LNKWRFFTLFQGLREPILAVSKSPIRGLILRLERRIFGCRRGGKGRAAATERRGCLKCIGDEAGDLVAGDQVHPTARAWVFLVASITDCLLTGEAPASKPR